VTARVVVVLGLAIAVCALSAYPFDDAYIHLRLARNLAFHGEPFFNLGERVMSGSSPLWLLWLASIFRVTGQPSPVAAIITEMLVMAALLYTAEGLLAQRHRRTWLTLGAATTIALLALPSAGGLMETPLATALFFAGLWAFRTGRFWWAGLLFGLAGATRFEMLVPALGAIALSPGSRARMRFILGAGPAWLALALFLYSSFGTVLPHAMVAKARLYRLHRADLWDMGPQGLGWHIGMWCVVALSLSTAAGLVPIVRELVRKQSHGRQDLLLLGLFPLALLGVYVARAPLVFPWYWPLSLLPMALFAWIRVVELRLPAATWTRAMVLTASAVSVAAVLALSWTAVESVRHTIEGELQRSPWVMENARTRTYLKIGALLAERCPSAVVGAPEIGALGWTFPGKILDGGGLASPEVLPYHPLRVPDERATGGVGAIPGRAIAAFRPDVVVSMELFAHDFVRKSSILPALADYRVWWKEPIFAPELRLPRTLWGSQWTIVFARSGQCDNRVEPGEIAASAGPRDP
jgi:hypothetical protein